MKSIKEINLNILIKLAEKIIKWLLDMCPAEGLQLLEVLDVVLLVPGVGGHRWGKGVDSPILRCTSLDHRWSFDLHGTHSIEDFSSQRS